MHLWDWWRNIPGLHIHTWGIKASPNKCTTILEMHSPTNVGEAQKLNGRLMSLSRFLLKLVEKASQFNKLLRKIELFLWYKACEQAFLEFEKTIVTLPVLSRPKPRVPLLLYLFVAEEAISLALVQEDGKHQIPIYFVSCVLHNAKKRY